ncbi:hypothetical protein ACH4LS_05510 [Streptomyces luteogriseus]|uniref:hypothetical protein n=1 Tax=Streptomyces luteogriseus TaxID=68233 RepID=UPI00378AFEA6
MIHAHGVSVTPVTGTHRPTRAGDRARRTTRTSTPQARIEARHGEITAATAGR